MKKAVARPQRDTARAIYDAAVDLFHEQGYRATNLRQIADAVGVQVGSLYNYMSSKERLLFEIMRGVMTDLVEGATAELDGVDDPLERVHRFMDHSIRFHGHRQKEVFIGNTELRSLSPARRRAIIELRDRYQALLVDALTDAAAAGQVVVADVRVTAYAGLAICSHAATWYREGGRLDLDEVARCLLQSFAPLAQPVADRVS